MDNLINVFTAVGHLLKIKFGLEFEQATGSYLIKVVKTMLSDMSMTAFEKAKQERFVAQYKAAGAKLDQLQLIAQPSAEQQDEITKVTSMLQSLEAQLQVA